VNCTGGAGFSCTGGANPEDGDLSLTCGQPTAAGAELLYCCTSGATTGSCAPASLNCFGGSTGLACTAGAAPDASLNCSSPEIGPSGDSYYCCGGTVGSCAQDALVTGCQGVSTGYSCTGSASPSSSGLWCSEGIAGTSGDTWYCCEPTPSAASSCVSDPTVSCATPGAYGFACSGVDTPADADRSLSCSDGVAGNDGNTLYCCQ
jgi:hypothetical protein